MPEHRFGDLEVGDDAVFQRPHRDDICRGASEHALGFVADGEHFGSARLHRHDRGFAQDDALILDVNQGVAVPRSIPMSLENQPKSLFNMNYAFRLRQTPADPLRSACKLDLPRVRGQAKNVVSWNGAWARQGICQIRIAECGM